MRAWYGVMVTLAGLFVLIAAACGDGSKRPSNALPGMSTSTAQPSVTRSPDEVRLERQYKTLRASHQVISGIWETLADNQPVSCGNYPTTLPPESITPPDDAALEPLAALLRRAAIDTAQALALWKAECAKPRANPSPATISEGLLAVRAAGDALSEAQALLDDRP